MAQAMADQSESGNMEEAEKASLSSPLLNDSATQGEAEMPMVSNTLQTNSEDSDVFLPFPSFPNEIQAMIFRKALQQIPPHFVDLFVNRYSAYRRGRPYYILPLLQACKTSNAEAYRYLQKVEIHSTPAASLPNPRLLPYTYIDPRNILRIRDETGDLEQVYRTGGCITAPGITSLVVLGNFYYGIDARMIKDMFEEMQMIVPEGFPDLKIYRFIIETFAREPIDDFAYLPVGVGLFEDTPLDIDTEFPNMEFVNYMGDAIDDGHRARINQVHQVAMSARKMIDLHLEKTKHEDNWRFLDKINIRTSVVCWLVEDPKNGKHAGQYRRYLEGLDVWLTD